MLPELRATRLTGPFAVRMYGLNRPDDSRSREHQDGEFQSSILAKTIAHLELCRCGSRGHRGDTGFALANGSPGIGARLVVTLRGDV